MEVSPIVLRKLGAVINSVGLNPDLLDDRLRKLLARLPETQGLEAINELERALITGRDPIKNPSGYFIGVIRRIIDSIDNHGQISAADAMGELTPRVIMKIQRMVDDGVIRLEDIDGRCRESLRYLSESEAISALDEVHKADRGKISNVTGYLMGVLKRFRIKREGVLVQGSSYSQYPQSNKTPDLEQVMLPPPPIIPHDLLYGYGDDEYAPDMPRPLDGMGFTPAVQEKLEELIQRGIISLDELDSKASLELQNLSEPHALATLREFSFSNLAAIRSKSAYIIGISRKINPREIGLEAPAPSSTGYIPPKYDNLSAGDGYFGSGVLAASSLPDTGFDHRGSLKKNTRDARAEAVLGFPGGIAKRPRQGVGLGQGQGGLPHEMDFGEFGAPLSHTGQSRERFGAGGFGNISQKFNNYAGRHGQGHGPPAGRFGGGGRGGGPATHEPMIDSGPELPSRLRIDLEIERHVRAGMLDDRDIDDGVREFLSLQPLGVAVKAIVDFAGKDMSKVNNKSAYLKGIVRKILDQENMGHPTSGGRMF